MTITLKVPSIACEACANTITKAINQQEPKATVSIDLTTKIVSVETDVPQTEIEQAIVAVGHTIES